MTAAVKLYNKLKIENPDKITVEEFCRFLQDVLPEELPCVAYPGEPQREIMPMLDYMLEGWDYKRMLMADLVGDKDYAWAEAVTETGGSEGVYLSIRLCAMNSGSAPERWPIITAKTLEEGPEAYAAMGALGGIVTYVIERFLTINY